MAITPTAGFKIDPNNPNGVIRDASAIPISTIISSPQPLNIQNSPVVSNPDISNIPVTTPTPTLAPALAPTANDFITKLETLTSSLMGRDIAKEQEVASTTADFEKSLNELNTQIKMHQANALARQEEALKSGETLRFASGTAQNVARTDAIEAMKLSALAQGMQGNILLATKQAESAINAEFSQQEKDIATARQNIINNYDTFTPEEKKRADVALATLNGKDAFVAEQKTNKDEIYKTVLIPASQNASNFVSDGTPAHSTLALTLDAISKAKTPQEALQIATANGLTGTKNLPASAQEYEYAKTHGYKGTYTQYQNEDANRKAIIAKAGASGLDNQTITRVQNVAGQFDNEQSVKNYQVVSEGKAFVDSISSNTTSAADDQGFIYAFAKIMDPNSVVREGEYATVQKYAQQWAATFGFSASRIFSNTKFLTEEAINNMKATISSKAKAAENNYKNIYNEYGRRINKITGKDDGTSWITDYSKGFTNNFPPTGQDISNLDFSFGGQKTNTPSLSSFSPMNNIQLSNSLSGLNFKF